MTTTRDRFAMRLIALAATLALATAGCGGDESEEPQGGVLQAFCDASFEAEATVQASFEGSGDVEIQPSLDALREAASAEIEEAVDTLVAAIQAAFEAPDSEQAFFEVVAASEPIDRFVADNCGYESAPVTAVDYAFEGVPATLPSGRVVFEFSNEGEEVHEMAVARIDESFEGSVQELVELPERESDRLIDRTGFAFAVAGESDFEVLALQPGRYVMVCFIPVGATSIEVLESGEATGPPHFAEGMLAEFTVE